MLHQYCMICQDKKHFGSLIDSNINIKNRLIMEFHPKPLLKHSPIINKMMNTHPHFMCGTCSFDRGQLRQVEDEIKRIIAAIIDQNLVDWKSREKLLRYLRGYHPQWYQVVERELRRKDQHK